MVKISPIEILTEILDMASFRHKIISSNIANADTPGYITKYIDFHGEMKKAISTGHHSSPQVYEHKPLLYNRDENTVSMELEMAKLVENALLYETSAHLLTKKFIAYKEAIKGRK